MNVEETVRGTVIDEGIVVTDVRLAVEGHADRHARTARPFRVRLEDGNEVRVDPSLRWTLQQPRVIEGRFGDLLEDPLGEAALDIAPGDHVSVRIEGVTLGQGDAVTLHGMAQREAPPGYRGAGPTRIARIAPFVIAPGHVALDAPAAPSAAAAPVEKEDEEEPAAPPQAGLGAGGVALLLGGAATAWAVYDAGVVGPLEEGTKLIGWLVGLTLVGLGLHGLQRRAPSPDLREIGEVHEGAPRGVDTGMLLMAAVPVLGAAAFAAWGSTHLRGSTDAIVTRAVIALTFAWPALHGFALLFDGGRSARILRLLRAPALDGMEAKRFGWLVGTLASGPLTWLRTTTSVTHTSHEQYVSGTPTFDGRPRVETRSSTSTYTSWKDAAQAPSAIAIQTEAGPVTLKTKGALFDSARPFTPVKNPKLEYSGVSYISHDQLEQHAMPGDRVLVVGRLRLENDAPTFVASGPESLALFAVPPGGSPRGALVRYVSRRALFILLLLGVSAVGASQLARLLTAG